MGTEDKDSLKVVTFNSCQPELVSLGLSDQVISRKFMISNIQGKIIGINKGSINLSLGENIAFELWVSTPSQYKIDENALFFTYMHWSSEQGPTLYGFSDNVQKQVFLLIIDCPGIGPKIGLSILAELGPTVFLHAIQTQDIKILSSVTGIGTKKAEQMIVQLKHKTNILIQNLNLSHVDQKILAHWQEVGQALEVLGYSKQEIGRALQSVKQESETQYSFELLMKKALQALSK